MTSSITVTNPTKFTRAASQVKDSIIIEHRIFIIKDVLKFLQFRQESSMIYAVTNLVLIVMQNKLFQVAARLCPFQLDLLLA